MTAKCKILDCGQDARVRVGPYAYLCETHSAEQHERLSEAHTEAAARRESRPERVENGSPSLEELAKALVAPARSLDRTRTRHQVAKLDLETSMRAFTKAIAALSQAARGTLEKEPDA